MFSVRNIGSLRRWTVIEREAIGSGPTGGMLGAENIMHGVIGQLPGHPQGRKGVIGGG